MCLLQNGLDLSALVTFICHVYISGLLVARLILGYFTALYIHEFGVSVTNNNGFWI
jgi:hypothetical protein